MGLAGIMGGLRTAVAPETRDVFLEAAFFAPEAIARARAARRSADRCQPALRARRRPGRPGAGDRARAGAAAAHRWRRRGRRRASPSQRRTCRSASPVALRARAPEAAARAWSCPRRASPRSSRRLGMQVWPQTAAAGVPRRPRIASTSRIEADLIEEVARIVGFEAIPEADAAVPQQFRSAAGRARRRSACCSRRSRRAATRRRSPSLSSIRCCRQALFPDAAGAGARAIRSRATWR